MNGSTASSVTSTERSMRAEPCPSWSRQSWIFTRRSTWLSDVLIWLAHNLVSTPGCAPSSRRPSSTPSQSASSGSASPTETESGSDTATVNAEAIRADLTTVSRVVKSVIGAYLAYGIETPDTVRLTMIGGVIRALRESEEEAEEPTYSSDEAGVMVSVYNSELWR